jgi:hypothetical protein
VTKAWNSSGGNSQSDRHITIYGRTHGETCPTAADSLSICSPTQNQTSTTSVHVFANGDSNWPITAMQVYIDNNLIYNDTRGTSYADTVFTVSKGPHSIVVKTFDTMGAR